VLNIAEGPWSSTLRCVDSILDPAGELSPHLLDLGRWIGHYYCCPLGRTLAAMTPQAVRRQRGFTLVRRASLAAAPVGLPTTRLGPKQRLVLDHLAAAGGPVDVAHLLEAVGATRQTLRGLVARGLVNETVTREVPDAEPATAAVSEPGFVLNVDQRDSVERIQTVIDARRFRVLLLYGVSGSGKTEVYVHAMRQVVAAGRQAILLVPEIALTTQLVRRLAARFERVAVIHSGLTDAERSVEWEHIRTARRNVVIGTRSAVFAPCPDLGLIVVDEEQDTSYKNLSAPRFLVRDVAIKRAQMLGIPIVLGSATPSLESWHNLERADLYERIDLPRRVRDLPLPQVRIVDVIDQPGPPASDLSPVLRHELAETLARGEQAVVLINRRGYAARLQCGSCGRRVQCPNCNANMVLHRSRSQVFCHHCQGRVTVPHVCADPSCRGVLVRSVSGTERVEEELRRALPQARISRADSDVMTSAAKYRDLVADFEAGRIDVLVGTQMIAKGLDFPNVSLVGVIGADPTAAAADFRSSERLFQLVTQVAGRAGRADVPGRVIVQTLTPDLPALRCAAEHDFLSFAAHELRRRRMYALPPFVRLARFVLADQRDPEARTAAETLAARLGEAVGPTGPAEAAVLGPHPCVIERIRNRYRYEVLLRASSAASLGRILDSLRHTAALRPRVDSFVIDVDPVSMT
jgi:primosomal protein N' (replication factor Y) (superfamily II helicase)